MEASCLPVFESSTQASDIYLPNKNVRNENKDEKNSTHVEPSITALSKFTFTLIKIQ